jgi:hypothetical protein
MKKHVLFLILLLLGSVSQLCAQAKTIHGTITKTQRDMNYEYPCGIIASILHQCDDTKAFVADIREDSGHVEQIIFFRRGPGPHPMTGDVGNWTLHRDAVYPYLLCAQRAALTSTGCMSEQWWTLEADEDIRLDQ